MNLRDYLKDLVDNLYTCARTQCGFCVYECPVRRVLGFETYSSRGRMHLARGIVEGNVDLTEKLVDIYFKCTLCGYCEAVCALDNTRIFRNVRKFLVSKNAVPRIHREIRDSIVSSDNPYSAERRAKTPVQVLPPRKSKTIIFLGCTIPISRRQILLSLKKFMEKSGMTLGYLGPDEYCCGLVLYEIGFEKEFLEQAEKNIKSFKESGVERIVTICPGCYIALKERYSEYFDVDYEVLHISEYLYELMNKNKIKYRKLSGEIVYHDPCHLTRHGKVVEEPRAVLEWLGLTVLEAPHYNKYYSRCCGGSILSFYPDLASEIGVMRLRELLSTGAETIVSGCEICEIALDKAAMRENVFVDVLDIVEVLSTALS